MAKYLISILNRNCPLGHTKVLFRVSGGISYPAELESSKSRKALKDQLGPGQGDSKLPKKVGDRHELKAESIT